MSQDLNDAQTAAADALVAGLVASLLALYGDEEDTSSVSSASSIAAEDAPLYYYPDPLKLRYANGDIICGNRPLNEIIAVMTLCHNGPHMVCWDAGLLAQFVVEVVEANGIAPADIVRIDIRAETVSCACSTYSSDAWFGNTMNESGLCPTNFEDAVTIEITVL
ncbi:hypothetical protein AURDEDRAFT_175715 [Auricularia subglabra TFB-10046 SS5]|nr:hypothetical protein AURDEDRAFT_175715 [Auricularia subglabra TFB-10046 SS5]